MKRDTNKASSHSRIIFGSGFSSCKNFQDFFSLVKVLVQNGCRCFDTAPSYRMEKIIGDSINACLKSYSLVREDFFVQTKIDAWQMQEGNGDVRKYVESALSLMGIEFFDSLLIHWPLPDFLEKTWDSLLSIKNRGIAKKIGICNLRLRHMGALVDKGILPDIIQIERHPLMVFQGEVDFCIGNEIEIQAYSPLCKMHPHIKESPILEEISKKYKKSIGQIVLRWHVDTGVSPVFTSKNPKRIEEYLDIWNFKLSASDITLISSLNEDYKLCLESCACPGF